MGANDPIYVANEPLSDSIVAAVLGAVGLTLSDRASGGILANPALSAGFVGKMDWLNASGVNLVDVAWGIDAWASTAEGTDMTILDLASDLAVVTPARYGMARVLSDRARAIDSWGITDWSNFAMDCTVSFEKAMLTLIMALSASVSEVAGNTGAAASWGHILEAVQLLGIANCPGPYVLITRPKDWGNMSTDALSLGGFIANDPETAAYKRNVNTGFKGVFLGGDLWVYTSDTCPVSAGDNLSMCFGAPAVGWNAHSAVPSPSTNVLLSTPLFMAELDRDGLKNEDDIVYSTQIGASLRQNAAAVQLPFLT